MLMLSMTTWFHYDRDGSIEWCESSDLREANDLDDWSLTERECFSLFS